MQVILNQDVEKIGQRGDIVDVSRAYVRILRERQQLGDNVANSVDRSLATTTP
jgi:ribosomal protein L9